MPQLTSTKWLMGLLIPMLFMQATIYFEGAPFKSPVDRLSTLNDDRLALRHLRFSGCMRVIFSEHTGVLRRAISQHRKQKLRVPNLTAARSLDGGGAAMPRVSMFSSPLLLGLEEFERTPDRISKM